MLNSYQVKREWNSFEIKSFWLLFTCLVVGGDVLEGDGADISNHN